MSGMPKKVSASTEEFDVLKIPGCGQTKSMAKEQSKENEGTYGLVYRQLDGQKAVIPIFQQGLHENVTLPDPCCQIQPLWQLQTYFPFKPKVELVLKGFTHSKAEQTGKGGNGGCEQRIDNAYQHHRWPSLGVGPCEELKKRRSSINS